MGPIDKALWYIESHYRDEITLDVLATVAGVSRHHLSRAFGYAVGIPITRYLRRRRLTLAAAALACGTTDILELALSLGYASHEAFTRAFKDCFGRTPAEVRTQGHTDGLDLMEARMMDESRVRELGEPQIADGAALLLAGLCETYTYAASAEIPGQWQSFGAWLGRVPGQVGNVAYGVIHNGDDDSYAYLTGVEVANFSSLPDELTRLRIPARTYTVFNSDAHVSEIRSTCTTIWSEWLPGTRFEAADAPWFERYPESFEPDTGYGGFEIWIPLG